MTKATKTATANEPVEQSLMDMVQAVPADETAEMLTKLTAAFDSRAAFEAAHMPGNSSIQKNLKTYRAKMVLPGIAALSVAVKLDPAFINASRSANAKQRFNVYAIDKIADLMHGLNTGHIRKAINRCIVESLFKFDKAAVPFTNEAARGAVSQNEKVGKDIAGLLVRHTAAPGTAATQASSTMSALALLGVVKNTGTPKHPVWALTDAPVVARLKEVVGA